jgi:CheY-like chemotaxis protein
VAFKILIVDDDPVFRAIAVELLSPWFDCIELDDGDSALEHLAHHTVDLIVTDVLMPRVDGLELIKAARGEGCYVPIIAVSGGGPGLDADLLLEMATAYGVDGVAPKPINRAAFLKLVIDVLQPSPVPAA